LASARRATAVQSQLCLEDGEQDGLPLQIMITAEAMKPDRARIPDGQVLPKIGDHWWDGDDRDPGGDAAHVVVLLHRGLARLSAAIVMCVLVRVW